MKKKTKKKIKKTTVKNKLDKLWSLIIKQKGRCEICGKIGLLNAHHVEGRRNLNLRWDVRNGCCLCAYCHTFGVKSAHNSPFWFEQEFKKRRPEDYKYIQNQIKKPSRPYSVEDYLKIEEQFKTLDK